MDIHVWWLFFIGTLLICASPGPNMLQVMGCGVRYGFRQAFFGMAGCFIPVFLYICISLAGVGTLLQAFPSLFNALRYAGAAYLLYLGIMSWRTPLATKADINEASTIGVASKTIFTRSLMVGLSNPKAILFATAYFPQFLDLHAPQAIQFAILLGTFSGAEITCYMIYALSGSKLTRIMQNTKAQQAFNRLSGSLLAGFGVLLLTKAR